MTTPDAVDYLKLVAAETNAISRGVVDQLFQLAGQVDSPALAEAVDLLTQLRNQTIEWAARFCIDGDDMHYSDGRRIETTIEIEPNRTLAFRWRPDPADPYNQPRTIVESHTCTNGRRVSVVVSAPGVLDVVEVRRV